MNIRSCWLRQKTKNMKHLETSAGEAIPLVWDSLSDSELVVKAENGYHGLGGVVEMMRRLKISTTCLTVVIIALMIVQILITFIPLLLKK